jgi:mannose-6-phosphate isomerase-like protein (cupin superfamily)
MSGFSINLEKKTLENNFFREVLYTAKHSQLVVMALKPGEDIGMEVHEEHDQFIRVERGSGKAVIDGEEHELADGYAVVIPAGS